MQRESRQFITLPLVGLILSTSVGTVHAHHECEEHSSQSHDCLFCISNLVAGVAELATKLVVPVPETFTTGTPINHETESYVGSSLTRAAPRAPPQS